MHDRAAFAAFVAEGSPRLMRTAYPLSDDALQSLEAEVARLAGADAAQVQRR